MDIQHVNVKLLVENPASIDLDSVIPVFHSWIQDRTRDELLLDVADYRHVPAGPGVVLIGHEANYSLDNTGERLGVRYNRKAPLDGTPQDRLRQATRAAILACRHLADDPRLAGKIRYDGRHLELFVNDRLLAPNDEASRKAHEPEFRDLLRKLFAGKPYSLRYDPEPRRLFSAWVETEDAFTPEDLLNNLES